MTEKIDTQGMSGPAIKGGKDNIYPYDSDGNPIYPRAIVRPNRLHTPEMVKELKILINEVLDEREHNRRLAAAYDDVKPLPPSYFDTEHFKHSVDEDEPPYQDWSQ